ncbi:MAG: hypothetical protein K9H18_17580, partial [Rhodospirillum sp.]|nr:hypothetical protein [Rhodospirillum sp.]
LGSEERFRPLGPEGGGRGSGLGLAIVKAVASAHRATLTLGESRLGGLAVDIRFPEATAPEGPGQGPEDLGKGKAKS